MGDNAYICPMDAPLPLTADGLGTVSAVAIRREMILTKTLSRLIRASMPRATVIEQAWLAALDGRAGVTHDPGTWLWDTSDAKRAPHSDHLDALREVLQDCELQIQDARPQRAPSNRSTWDVLIRTALTSAEERQEHPPPARLAAWMDSYSRYLGTSPEKRVYLSELLRQDGKSMYSAKSFWPSGVTPVWFLAL